VDENVKMKSDNQTRLHEKERVTSINMKLTADQPIFEDLSGHWHREAEELEGRIGRMASENERLYSTNQQLSKQTFRDHQNLNIMQRQLDLAMTRLDRYADVLEVAIQKRADRNSAVRSLIGELSRPKRLKGNRQHKAT
jgi:stress response protein YsnF